MDRSDETTSFGNAGAVDESTELYDDAFPEPVARSWRNYLIGSSALRQKLGHDLEQELGVSISDYAVLFHLARHPERRLRMAQLAESICYTRSRTTQIVARMERAGHVVRDADLADGRGVLATLTASGLDVVVRGTGIQRKVANDYFLRFFSEEDLARLGEAFGEVIRALSAFDCSGTPSEVFSRG